MEPTSDKKHVWDKVNKWEEELLFLKSIIDKTELVETIKWGGPVYVFNKKMLSELEVLKNILQFGFLMAFF